LHIFSTPARADHHAGDHRHADGEPAHSAAVTMYKSPTCGCCGKWAEHMRENGFSVEEIATENMDEIKQKHGVPASASSCHTAIIDGLIVEGHVPARDILDLLESDRRDGVVGIAVPRMPLGSPGMDFGREQAYASYVFTADGESEVFREHVPGTAGYSGKPDAGHAGHKEHAGHAEHAHGAEGGSD
jgi:hypothetical protein